ncbi:MAG: peptide deformylase [Bacteroidales bacterium]|nr:peptide deformylase [Bacteroidales bacterium]
MKKLDLLSVAFAAAIALTTILTIVFTSKKNMAGIPDIPCIPSFTDEELNAIAAADTVMRVLTVDDTSDLKVLRRKSIDINAEDLLSEAYSHLSDLMVSTVTSPEQGGVGIAAPQIGLGRRVVAVQRFDKAGEPFEVYPNIQIDSLYGDIVPGREGCLSVPGKRGMVPRYTDIIVSYTNVDALRKNPSDIDGSIVRDTISGFTAVIFQHEVDHLDGILYTDRTDDVQPR